MQPLKEFVCDFCGGMINSPEEGYLEWIEPLGEPLHLAREFKVVHQSHFSPLKKSGRDCYHHTNQRGRADLQLSEFVGQAGMSRLLNFLDAGPMFIPDYKASRIKNMREFVELLRRLTIPYYEEARLHWVVAETDGFFQGVSSVKAYFPSTLQLLIYRYGGKEA